MTTEIIGLDRIKAIALRVERGMDPNISKKLDAVADKIKADAQAGCPVGTPQSTGIRGYIGGSLKRSIRKEAVARPAGTKWEIGIRAGGYVTNPNTGRIVHYAVFVERGTSIMIARPFMRNALFSNRTEIESAIREAMKDSVEEAKKA
jgi:HK97 gp10 family phage protein